MKNHKLDCSLIVDGHGVILRKCDCGYYDRHLATCAISLAQAEASGKEGYRATINAYAGVECDCGLEEVLGRKEE